MGQYKDEMLNPLYITRFIQSGLAGAVLALSAYRKSWSYLFLSKVHMLRASVSCSASIYKSCIASIPWSTDII